MDIRILTDVVVHAVGGDECLGFLIWGLPRATMTFCQDITLHVTMRIGNGTSAIEQTVCKLQRASIHSVLVVH